MFSLKDDELKELGALVTVREIEQQPIVWGKTYEIYQEKQGLIKGFLDGVLNSHGKAKVIFTGAGTSAYAGDVVSEYLRGIETGSFEFESVATTDIVSCPYNYFKKDEPVILVSFARSGNSPESVEAVNLANKLVDNIYHLVITCAKDGKLAISTRGSEKDLVLIMPEGTNDKGFAMTSSFTCMVLMATLIFDVASSESEKTSYIDSIMKLGNSIVEREAEINKLLDRDFNRIVYLGSGLFGKLAREAQLKILELTAGRITTCFDSSMGFRHGPKSFVDEKTIVVDFVSTDQYTQQYDVDILNEIMDNGISPMVAAVTKDRVDGNFYQFTLNDKTDVKDVYLALPFIMVAQIISVRTSVKVGNTPDTPSASGTVNRVVKGVIIHQYYN